MGVVRALLFSGGIDSTALAHALRPERLVFIDYGQLAAAGERRAARSIAGDLQLALREIAVDLRSLGSGSMARGAAAAGDHVDKRLAKDGPNVPPEHWPYRNQALVTIAAMALASENVEAILIGTVAGDDAHDDGTPAFREALGTLLSLQSGPDLQAPIAERSIEEWLRAHPVPEDVMRWSFSCHVSEWACGACRGCAKHDRVMSAIYDR